MTEDLLKKRYSRLLTMVRKYRGLEREYFKYRVKTDLVKLKALAREIDAQIEKDITELNSNQLDLL